MKRLVYFIIVCIMSMCVVGCNTSDNKKVSDKKVSKKSDKDTEKHKDDNTDNEVLGQDEDSDENISAYAEANYFNKSLGTIKEVIVYKDGKVKSFDASTYESKEILRLLKKRFVNLGENIVKDIDLGSEIKNIKANGQAVEVVFEKTYSMGTEPAKVSNYKSISLDVDSWFFSLSGKYTEYFTYLPKSEYTLGRISDASDIEEFLTDF